MSCALFSSRPSVALRAENAPSSSYTRRSRFATSSDRARPSYAAVVTKEVICHGEECTLEFCKSNTAPLTHVERTKVTLSRVNTIHSRSRLPSGARIDDSPPLKLGIEHSERRDFGKKQRKLLT